MLGVEPRSQPSQGRDLSIELHRCGAGGMDLNPHCPAYKAGVLPLDDTSEYLVAPPGLEPGKPSF